MKTNCPDCGQPLEYSYADSGEDVDCPHCDVAFMLPARLALEPDKVAPPPKKPPTPPNPNKKLINAASTFSCLSLLCVFVPYVGLLIAVPMWIAGFVLCIMLLVKGQYSSGAGTMVFLFLLVPFAWALRLGYALGDPATTPRKPLPPSA